MINASPFKQIAKDLRERALDLCDEMQEFLREHGHETSAWRFDTEKDSPGVNGMGIDEVSVQPFIECVYETENERRRVLFLGPRFLGRDGQLTAALLRPDLVRDWFQEVSRCRSALALAMDDGSALTAGILPWSHYGIESDLLCVLDGRPLPKVMDFPIEQVLPRRCFVQLVYGMDKTRRRADTPALVEAAEAARGVVRRGRDVVWIEKWKGDGRAPRSTEHLTFFQPRSLEEGQQQFLTALYVKDGQGTPRPPSLMVLVHLDELPTIDEAIFPQPVVQPETAIMWANFLSRLLALETTFLIVTRVPDIDSYPAKVPPLVEPWRAVSKFERVYRSTP